MSEPIFKQGDTVRHRASGELGIVKYIKEKCLVHPHCMGEVFAGDGKGSHGFCRRDAK